MLFSSPVFVFAFLPPVLLLFLWLQRHAHVRASFALLVLASLFFYAWWKPLYLPILVGSILFNYAWGRLLARRPPLARTLLGVGIGANLALLGWFKYAGFFAETLGALLGSGWTIEAVLLPLGISFFTFQQIAYLVDTHEGKTRHDGPLEYALFVSFFPQLIAGPIVHHGEMLGQFVRGRPPGRVGRDVLLGLSVFAVGLFKKLVLADGVAPYADTVFALAGSAGELDLLCAWTGALAYTLQLYFDFSGYSDMAIGLGLLFGIRLPLNFDSPYRSSGIIEFWRRWHMTLSRFLRDYLYIPLGGGRGGNLARYRNLMIVMLLGGLWHGAGWTFVLWGALHGTYLLINHAWRAALRASSRVPRVPAALARTLSVGVTFLAVVVAWVFFRAEDLGTATRLLGAMAGAEGIALPSALLDPASAPGSFLLAIGAQPREMPGLGPLFVVLRDAIALAGGTPSDGLVGSLTALATLVPLLLIVFFAPNTQTLFPIVAASADTRADPLSAPAAASSPDASTDPRTDPAGAQAEASRAVPGGEGELADGVAPRPAWYRPRWRPAFGWTFFSATLAAYALFGTTGDAAFLYFNF